MKISFLLLFAVLISGIVPAQKQIQVRDQRFEMNAIREGKPVKLETKKFGLKINYETGEFFAKINIEESRLYDDDEVEYRIPGDEIIEISGIIPINEIIDNKEQNRQYVFELNVIHLSTNIPVVFTFDVAYIQNSAAGFTMFRINGEIDLRYFGVVDLKGYDPIVGLFLGFQGYMIGN